MFALCVAAILIQQCFAKPQRRRDVVDVIVGGFESFGDDFLDGMDSMGDFFIDIGEGIGDGFTDFGEGFLDGWGEVENFFEDDFVDFWTDDFAGFWEDFGESFVGFGEDVGDIFAEGFDATGDFFVAGWDGFVDGMETAGEWTADAAVTGWNEVDNFFTALGCWADDTVLGSSCTNCIEDACNNALDDEMIDQISAANGLALQDADDAFDDMINGCTAALEKCPSLEVCNDLFQLPPETRVYVSSQIKQCNLCYQCLPYGSTREGCKAALDASLPNECAVCTEQETQMYNSFYACSGIKEIVDTIGTLGESLKEGADGRESLDNLCNACQWCSDYQEDLQQICSDWWLIKVSWDFTAPEIPNALVPPMVEVTVPEAPAPEDWRDEIDPVPAPTKNPTPEAPPAPTKNPTEEPAEEPAVGWCALPIEAPGGRLYGDKGPSSKADDACDCAVTCAAKAETKPVVAWVFREADNPGKKGKCTCLTSIDKVICKRSYSSGVVGDGDAASEFPDCS